MLFAPPLSGRVHGGVEFTAAGSRLQNSAAENRYCSQLTGASRGYLGRPALL